MKIGLSVSLLFGDGRLEEHAVSLRQGALFVFLRFPSPTIEQLSLSADRATLPLQAADCPVVSELRQ